MMNSVTPQSNLMGLVLLQVVQIGQLVPSQAQCPATVIGLWGAPHSPWAATHHDSGVAFSSVTRAALQQAAHDSGGNALDTAFSMPSKKSNFGLHLRKLALLHLVSEGFLEML